ncbi:hypothetical protein Tco_1372987 [Tanacetum coccineum]
MSVSRSAEKTVLITGRERRETREGKTRDVLGEKKNGERRLRILYGMRDSEMETRVVGYLIDSQEKRRSRRREFEQESWREEKRESKRGREERERERGEEVEERGEGEIEGSGDLAVRKGRGEDEKKREEEGCGDGRVAGVGGRGERKE